MIMDIGFHFVSKPYSSSMFTRNHFCFAFLIFGYFFVKVILSELITQKH